MKYRLLFRVTYYIHSAWGAENPYILPSTKIPYDGNQINKDNTNDSFSEIIEYSNSDNDKDIFLKRINEE